LGNCDDLSMMNLALNCWFSQCCNMLTAKLSPCYSTYLLFNLWLNNRTITRFIADDKVVYQRMRWEMRLAWDNSWARRRLKHLSWRSRWIILYTLEQTIAVSCKILRVDRCLFWLFHLTEHKVLHCCATNAVYSAAWLPHSCTRLVDSFKHADCQCFQLSNHCQEIHSASFVHHTVSTDRDFKS